MKPQFSIIIPTLNEEKFLPRLLDSLGTQTYKHFEVIVVDGSSTDKTIVKAKTFLRKVPHLTILTEKRGVSHQRNAGAAVAKGDWLLFVDADGTLLPYAMARMAIFVATKKPKLATCWFMPDSDEVGDAVITLLANLTSEGSISVQRPFAPGPLTMVQKDVFRSVGGYDESISFAEDYDLSKRLYDHGVALSIVRETLCVYSLRRFRKEGRLKTLQVHGMAALMTLFTRNAPKSMGKYPMGGAPYGSRPKAMKPSALKKMQLQVQKLIKELLE